jgi:hypothetical protein
VAYLRKLNEETDAIEKNITELVVYSNGSVTWSEAWEMSSKQRASLVKTINDYNQAKAGKSPTEQL